MKEKPLEETAPPKSVWNMTESLHLFHRTAYANECMADRRLHAKMQWKTAERIGIAVQAVTRARSALSESVRLGSIQTACLQYFVYERRLLMLRIKKSQQSDFSSLS